VVVAVTIVSIVEVAIHEVVDVVAMRDSCVPAARPVDVAVRVALARVAASAARRVICVDGDHALVDVAGVLVVEVAVVEVVDMSVVENGAMTAVGAMHVIVPLVDRVGAHRDETSAEHPNGNRVSSERDAARCRLDRGHGMLGE
jgi:hypothetical protein